jgi:ribonuclease D
LFEDTPLVMVEDEDALDHMLDTLSTAKVIGIDTESDSSYAYQEKVCLIQVSNHDTDFIIDPLAFDDLSALGDILADRSVVKVLHGADYDIVCLKRDYGFEIRGLFDTLIAAQLLGMERIGLADLIERFFGIELDKKYQRHNWALRPLQKAHLDYARGDTHWMAALRELVSWQLEDVGRMRHMREECRILEEREWGGRVPDPHAFLSMKKADTLDDDGLRVLRHVFAYREAQAKKMNRPVYKVIPNDVLLQLSRKRPSSRGAFDDMLRSKRAMLRRHGKGLWEALQAGLEDDEPLPRKKKTRKAPRKGPKSKLRGRHADRVFAALKEWRTELLDARDDLTPFNVASNSILKSIASVRPVDLEEMAAIPDVRQWQVDDWGEEILELLDREAPLD